MWKKMEAMFVMTISKLQRVFKSDIVLSVTLFLEIRTGGLGRNRAIDMMRIFILLTSLLVLMSCKSEPAPVAAFDKITYFETFQNVESLNEENFIHSVPPASIDFRVIDTLCIFSTDDSKNGYFKICALSDFSIIAEVVKKGNGPDELLWYQYFNEIAFRHQEDTLVAYLRNNKRQMSRWNITETLMCGYADLIPFTEPFKGTMNLIYLNDSLTFATRLRDNDTRIEREIYSRDKVEHPMHLAELSDSKVKRSDGRSFNALSMIYAYDNKHGKIVEAGASQNIINIYSIDGSFNQSVCIGLLSDYDVNDIKSWPMAYEHLDLCHNFIAALYYEDTNYNHSMNGSVLPSIRIFSWEGIPVLELHLNRHATNFEFDFTNRKLYTLNSEDETFCQYDISELFHRYSNIFK